ncbi:MAG: hypothetical protein ACAI43_19180 [Phycisphaerae bacterium]
MQCNIDARGKAVRLKWGFIWLALGVLAALAWALPLGGPLAWTVAAALAATGAFMIFESRAGWCAVRAMGFKTKI